MNKILPKFARWLLCSLRNKTDHESLIGDYDEMYHILYNERGTLKAKIWYWTQILKSIPSFFSNSIYWSITMLKNYLKIAVRNLKNNSLNTSINILGLSIAFGFCVLVLSFIRDEYTYDRFHENADSIYEMISKIKIRDDFMNTGTQSALGPTLPGQFPEIISSARITKEDLVVKYNDRIFTEKFICTEPEFFDVFTFPVETGMTKDPVSVLNSVIISPETAERYFGNEDPLGKILLVKIENNFKSFTVSGILKKIPANSSLKPDFIINIQNIYGKRLNDWSVWNGPTVFIRLQNKEQAQSLINKFPSTIDKHLHEKGLSKESGYQILSLTEHHLNGYYFSPVLSHGSKKIYSYILSGIAVLVLIIAISNFINLSVGGSFPRTKEIGIRKVFGAQRKQLIRQFLFEAVILSFFAVASGILLAVIFLPSFNMMSQKTLSLDYLLNWQFSAGLFGLAAFIGIAAGSYPAVIFSRFVTVDLFRKVFRFSGKNAFSRTMIIFQFMISIFFIISTIIIFDQYNFMLNSKMGLNSDNVMVLELTEDYKNPGATKAIYTDLKNKLLSKESILSMSASDSKYDIFSATLLTDKNKNRVVVGLNWVDYNYLDFFGIKLLEGRYFSTEHPSDAGKTVIVNKTLVDRFEIEDPVGKKLSAVLPTRRNDAEIIGVVEDFHYSSLREKIRPAYLSIAVNRGYRYIYLRIIGENIRNTVNLIKNELKKTAPDMPFLYTFIDDEIAQKYENEKRYGRMFSFVSFFAILIACSGLFGLTSLALTRRTKEISIRKVLGASIPRILKLISKEFQILVIIGNIFAWPAAYYAAEYWLQNFAYKININLFPFIAAGIITFIIASVTIGVLIIKAVRQNPVDTLRYE